MRVLNGEQVMARIFIGESDRCGRQPLSVALLERLRKEGFAGATEYRGVAGFGAHSVLHTTQVLRLSQVSAKLPESIFWKFLAFHQTHVPWAGCSLHDLIQPSFSLLVGVALPFSLARRATEGQSAWRRTFHAFWRALVLGTRDYVRKCGFSHVVIGVSGGIDSALTAAIAAEAIGADQVLGVLMPSPFSSRGSILL